MARVVLTQPEPRAGAIAVRLRARGHEVLVPALSRIVELAADVGGQALAARLAEFDCVVVVSPSAVHAVARRVPVWPATVLFALIGPGSRAALDDAGFVCPPQHVVMPQQAPFDGAALSRLPPFDAPDGLRILVLRGERGSDGWIDDLRSRGADVQVCAVYRHEPLELDDEALAALKSWIVSRSADACIVVTQAATVDRLDAALQRAGVHGQAMRMQALAIHPRIVAALRQAGWQRVRQIDPGESALVRALESRSGMMNQDGY